MKTKLPSHINTIEEAKLLLTDLHNNGESFHPEDNAQDCLSDITDEEAQHLNELMNEIYLLKGNESYLNMIFDPCAFLLWLMMPDTLNNNHLDNGNYDVKRIGINQLDVNGWAYTQTNINKYVKNEFVQPS